MLLKQGQVRILLILVVVGFIIISVISMRNIPLSPDCPLCICDKQNFQHEKSQKSHLSESDHKLCIIVPFRDRYEELFEFAPYMQNFLNKQGVEHEIWILNQMDGYRFNRASLINVGFRESSSNCDYIAMHDVDLLPANTDLKYSFPSNGPFHVASPDLHPKYNYPTFVGGILLLTRKQFEQVNGLSNKYWGWGLEDDEFFVRLRQANLEVERPKGIRTGRKGTFKHIHSTKIRTKRDMGKCYNQQNMTRRRDRDTGLNNVQYTIARKYNMEIESTKINLLNVILECNRTFTPWCNCTGAPPDTGKIDRSRDEDVVVPLIPKRRN